MTPHQSPITSHQSLRFRSPRRHRAARARARALRRAGRGIAADAHARARPGWIYAHPEHELDAAAREQYFSLIARRASGVPTQHLTGHQEFWGLDFEVTPDVLIPRPETEHVIEVALERLGGEFRSRLTASQRRISHRGRGHRLRLHRHRAGARIARRADHRHRHFRRRARSRAPQRRAPRRRFAHRFRRMQSAGFVHATRVTRATRPRVTLFRSHRQQPALHRPPGSRDAAARSPRARAGSRPSSAAKQERKSTRR